MGKAMEKGKVPEEVLIRSVLNTIGHRRREVLVGPAVGQDCSAAAVDEGDVIVLSTDPITGTSRGLGRLGTLITTNDIAAAGAEPVGIMMTLLLPEGFEEEALAALMAEAEETCQAINVEIMGGHTEMTDAVNRPVITVTGIGRIRRDKLNTLGDIRPGDAIIVTKSLALEAVSILAAERGEELKAYLPEALVTEAAGFGRYLSIIPEAAAAASCKITSMHDITEGGVYGALWEMGAGAGLGLEVDGSTLPVTEAARAVCRVMRIDPCRAMSSGSLLITTPEPETVLRAIREAGVEAVVIGHMTGAGEDRLVRHDDGRVRILDRPETDALYEAISRKIST